MIKKIVFPGSFDPITKGHFDLIKRSSLIFDEVTVLIFESGNKKNKFQLQDRLDGASVLTAQMNNVKVESGDGLLINWMSQNQVKLVLRGIRSFKDYDYEMEYIANLKMLDPEIEVVLLPVRQELIYVSSSRVRELVNFDTDLSSFLNQEIIESVKSKT